MTAKVLQLVNSSFFGLAVHVHDVHHAAALLGLNALKPLVLSAGVFRQLEESRVPAALAEQVLEHSLAVGCLREETRRSRGTRPRSKPTTRCSAGILHDIGKLVLADHFGRDYALVCLAADKRDLPLLSAELDQFDASHADVGGYLLGLWGLPQDLIEAVAFHHDPAAHEVDRFSPLTAVHVANALVHADRRGESKIRESLPHRAAQATIAATSRRLRCDTARLSDRGKQIAASMRGVLSRRLLLMTVEHSQAIGSPSDAYRHASTDRTRGRPAMARAQRCLVETPRSIAVGHEHHRRTSPTR